MRQIESLRGATTVLFVTHRLDTARIADRVAVLEDGRLQGQGGYEELLEGNTLVQSLAANEDTTAEQRYSENDSTVPIFDADEGVVDEDR